MKKFLFLIVLLSGMFCYFSACKKKNYDTDRVAFGTLLDTSGMCMPKVVNGNYMKDSTLILYNYIDVHVDVDTVGTYVIKSDTVNGYSFYGYGTFGKRGDNLVRIYGRGKPIAPGLNTFTVNYGASSCMVDILVTGTATPPAIYKLDTTGTISSECPGAVIGGTYTAATPLGSSNTVALKVNVTTPGTYTLTSNVINGMAFSGAGTFTSAGVQTIVLQGTGTPSTGGGIGYNLTVQTGSVSCIFTVTVN